MDVIVAPSGEPSLDAAEDFTSLRLTGTRPSSPDARATLRGAGIELDADDAHGHIGRDVITRLAGSLGGDPAWQDGLARMMAYASDHGWTDGEDRVRAHADWYD